MRRLPFPGTLTAAALIGVAACEGAQGTPVSARHVVEMRGFEFLPASLVVARGDTVVWVNRDFVPHTATSPTGAWGSDAIAAGDSLLHVFSEAEGGDYYCAFHPGMRGRIDVR